MTLKELTNLMRDHLVAPGSECGDWQDYVEDCVREYGLTPWDAAADVTVPSVEFVAHDINKISDAGMIRWSHYPDDDFLTPWPSVHWDYILHCWTTCSVIPHSDACLPSSVGLVRVAVPGKRQWSAPAKEDHR